MLTWRLLERVCVCDIYKPNTHTHIRGEIIILAGLSASIEL